MPPPIVNGTKTLSAVRRGGAFRRGRAGGVWGGGGQRGAALVGGGDVEEDELSRARGVIALGELDWVAGVADVHEVRPLDDPSGVDVQARDDSLVMHGRPYLINR